MNLPALIGSEKQVAWAEDIRQLWVDSLTRYRSEATEEYPVDETLIESLEAALMEIESAKFYINIREEILWVKNPRFEEYGVFSGYFELESMRRMKYSFKRLKKSGSLPVDRSM